MALLCESEAGCSSLAAVRLTVLAPTGETIDSDTGTDPVLSEALSRRLCGECAAKTAAVAAWTVEVLGGYVETAALEADEVLELDPITLAKAEVERGLYAVEHRAHDARATLRTVTSRTVRIPEGVRTWAR